MYCCRNDQPFCDIYSKGETNRGQAASVISALGLRLLDQVHKDGTPRFIVRSSTCSDSYNSGTSADRVLRVISYPLNNDLIKCVTIV